MDTKERVNRGLIHLVAVIKSGNALVLPAKRVADGKECYLICDSWASENGDVHTLPIAQILTDPFNEFAPPDGTTMEVLTESSLPSAIGLDTSRVSTMDIVKGPNTVIPDGTGN